MSFLSVDWGGYVPVLVDGLVKSIELTAIGFVGACLVGFVVAVLRMSQNRVINAAGYLYTELFKNLPIITGIFIIYFGLTGIGLVLDAFTSGWLALSLFYGAYLAEIFRGGLQGVSRGQTEAARALGLTPARVLLTVQLPQAVRLALPATATMLVDLLKGTALLVTIGGGELMTQATIITSETFQPLEVYIVIGLIYVVMSWPLARLAGYLESQLREGTAMSPTSRKLRRITRARLAQAATVTTGGKVG
ncbi:amino acid ABC transporter permease [Streptosporangium sp. NPDC049644]|uniref:amino acid ABC transporter permease n=1 Tax=Streptosporangium sp. NPDC049644 TaxID=3155507 RepID=UPI00341EB6AE